MTDFRISDTKFWYKINDTFGNSGGIYILKSFNNDGSVRRTNRLLTQDNEGIIYIGKAQSFLNRVIELKKSLSPEHSSSNHECGYRHKNHSGISDKFPYDSLFVTLIHSDNPKELESSKLAEYQLKFGELPPLNHSG